MSEEKVCLTAEQIENIGKAYAKEIEEYRHKCVRCGEHFIDNVRYHFFCHNCRPIPWEIKKRAEKRYGRVVA